MSILGMWMWPDLLLQAGVSKTFDYLALAGVTDVYLLTKGLNGKTLFPYPKTQPVCPGRDLLREALDAARGRGLRLHAWFTSAGDAAYAAAHPERSLYHLVNGPHARIVSLADTDYHRFMRQIIRHTVREYGPDGVHLDYIRYNHIICGWSEEDMARYAAYGVNVGRLRQMVEKTCLGEAPDGAYLFNRYRMGDRDVHLLAEARRQDVRTFAHVLADAARDEKPDIQISAALMPEGAYDDLAFSDLHYGQNFRDMADIVDMALPMSYSRTYQQGSEWVAMVARNTLRCGLPTLAGIHAFEGGTGQTVQEDVTAALAVEGICGVCLFRAGAVMLAWADAHELRLYNPSSSTLSRLVLQSGEQSVSVQITLPPYQEITVSSPFRAVLVRAFAGDTELPVYLCQKK